MLSIRIESEGRTFHVPPPPGRMVIGSAPGCQVVLRDPAVEASHLTVEHTPAGLRISDNGTRNGTKLNGLFVSQAIVREGDQILVGGVRLSVVAPSVEIAPIPGIAFPAAPPAPPPGVPPAVPPAPLPPAAAPVPPPPPPFAPRPAPAPAAPAPKLTSTVPPSARVRANGKSRKWPWFVGIGAFAVVLFAAGFLLSSGESSRLKMAAETYRKAHAAWEAGRLDEAERLFRKVAAEWPDAADAERSLAALKQLDEVRRRERAAAAALEGLRKEWSQLRLDELRKEYRRLRDEHRDTAAFSDEAGFLAEMKRQYDAETSRRFEATRARANALLRENRFHEAILAWHEYIYVPQNVDPDIDRATDEFKRIQVRAKESWEELEGRVDQLIDAGNRARARELLEENVELFRGTRFTYDLRQKLELLSVLAENSTVAPEAAAARVSERKEYLRAAEDAEALATRRRYADAVAAYRRAAQTCPHPDLAAEFRERAEALEDTAVLFTELQLQIRTRPERFRDIDLGHGFRANAVDANEEELVVSVRGAESKVAWSRLGPERILPLMERLDIDAEGHLRLARFALKGGNEEIGHGAVTAALRQDEDLRDRAFEVLAKARGIPVPAGGFALHKGRWITPTELAEAQLREEIDAAAKDAGSSDARRREKGLAKLRELGKPAERTLIRVLEQLLAETVGELKSHPAVRDPAAKAQLLNALQERRKAALALIFDTEKYPYPHPEGPAYDQVQAEVDQLVEAVRVIWERPLAWLVEKYPEVADLYSRAEGCSIELKDLGHAPAQCLAELVAEVDRAIDMPRFAPDSKLKGDLEWNDQVLRYNREVKIDADGPERDCVDAVNGYRMMMGMRAVMWNDKLLACARAHSTHMKTHGYFAHDVPLPGSEYDDIRTPGRRAQKAGYGGGVSENIARGSEDGRQTFRQWYGSSGHHRNMLGKNHTEIGVGRDGDFWTQNFGSQKKKVD